MDVLLKPIITEKTSQESEMNSRYTFMVDKSFNKIEIKQFINLVLNELSIEHKWKGKGINEKCYDSKNNPI